MIGIKKKEKTIFKNHNKARSQKEGGKSENRKNKENKKSEKD